MPSRWNAGGVLHHAHDERSFRSLLDLEYQWCLHSGRAFHVLLCRLSTRDGMQCAMDQTVKSALVSAVRESLDTMDHMGWFLQDLVLGALLVGIDAGQSPVFRISKTDQIRRLVENRFCLTHPSLVLQFYDYLDLPPFQHRKSGLALDRENNRGG